jgi:putative DNA primase/helicase
MVDDATPAAFGSWEDERRRIDRARLLWAAAKDPRGTIAEKYLHSRKLDLHDEIANRAIRFHGCCPWRDEATNAVILVPAMIAAMRSIADDNIRAVHRTRLTNDGRKVGRRMLGVAKNAAIKLDRSAQSSLAIGEGIETCLAARQLGLGSCWALGSASAIGRFPILAGISRLRLLAENDDANAKAIEACGRRWYEAGRTVEIVRPNIRCNDMNDLLRRAP